VHTGGIALLEGPAPPYADVLEHVRSRLHRVPRYRRRLAVPPFGLGDPRWVDDPAFNLAYHVRHTGLPAPGDAAKLHALAARVFSQALDRSKPLWELWIVEHLEGGGWALVSKAGLELTEDAADVDLLATLFDTAPDAPPAAGDHWEPGPAPSPAQLAAAALTDGLRPAAALTRARRIVDAAAERTGVIGPPRPARPAPSPLAVRTGPHRRLAVTAQRLDDFRAIRDAFGGTVNDAVLAVVAGALRRWLHERATRTEGLDVRAGVPVQVEGGRLVQVECPLPVDVLDPIERLRAITAHMEAATRSRGAVAAQVIAGAGDFAPPTILARAARLTMSSRAESLLVTNVPGPQAGLYALGRRLERTYPIPTLVDGHALAVAVMSYDGGMDFGLLADYDAVPDLDVFAAAIADALGELLALAGGGPLTRRAPRTTKTRARARAKRRGAG
jgi:WS/DGAT/MGAT family acyltransferase